MNKVDLTAYKDLYLKTTHEHLVNLKKNLKLLENNSVDKNAIYEVFRYFHSLKSQNFFMGYQNTAQLCKLFEDSFRKVNESKVSVDPQLLEIANEVADKLENNLKMIENQNKEQNFANDITSYENKLINL